jgi:hypothetical protein
LIGIIVIASSTKAPISDSNTLCKIPKLLQLLCLTLGNFTLLIECIDFPAQDRFGVGEPSFHVQMLVYRLFAHQDKAI